MLDEFTPVPGAFSIMDRDYPDFAGFYQLTRSLLFFGARARQNFHDNKQYEDAGYVNGKRILDSKEKSSKLEGPTAGRSHSFEAYETKDRPLDAGDFDINFDEQTQAMIFNK